MSPLLGQAGPTPLSNWQLSSGRREEACTGDPWTDPFRRIHCALPGWAPCRLLPWGPLAVPAAPFWAWPPARSGCSHLWSPLSPVPPPLPTLPGFEVHLGVDRAKPQPICSLLHLQPHTPKPTSCCFIQLWGSPPSAGAQPPQCTWGPASSQSAPRADHVPCLWGTGPWP